MPLLIRYDEARTLALVRNGTAEQLLRQLEPADDDTPPAAPVRERLPASARRELADLLREWTRRALGAVPLRDAILVDPQRGERVYSLLCAAHEEARAPLPPLAPEAAATLATAVPLTPRQVRAVLSPAERAPLEPLLVPKAGSVLVYLPHPETLPRCPLPAALDTLLPDPPAPLRQPTSFEQPVGWRRTLALGFAMLGIIQLAVPLLFGQMPNHPAALPLGLLTLALLVGIRAGWTGYLGSLCIWLVPNLPWFRHGQPFAWLPTIGLLLVGMLLLTLDARIRAMWRWLRQRARRA